MSPEFADLARRAIACRHWRWMPGMLTDVGERVTDAAAFYLGTLPDLSDPLTVQALLLLVREAWGTQTAWVEPGHDGLWEMCIYVHGKCQMLASYQTEAEALVAALEVDHDR